RTYVDNSYNRSVGRVGLPSGSSSYGFNGGSSRQTHNTYSSSGTYVDNAFNRRADRVGLPLGSAVISSNSSSFDRNSSQAAGCSSSSLVRTYTDNSFNRNAGRVGLPVGSAVISNGSQNTPSVRSKTHSSNKTYVDNSQNRSRGRVGLPLGSAIASPASQSASKNSSSHSNFVKVKKVYVDNAMNRLLGRVGQPRGSMAAKSDSNEILVPGVDLSEENFDEKYKDVPEEQLSSVVEAVLQHFTRVMEVKKWEDESKLENNPKSGKKIVEKFTGTRVQFEDIELRSILGRGAFGEVYAAKYQDSFIAVKKLRIQQVSKKIRQSFIDEIQILCRLEHPNVVKFIGACVVAPNLCICMEYMKLSLYEALHMQERDFSEAQKIKLVSNISSGLAYLHSCEVAHCDVKSQNVLLNYEADSMDDTLTAKLTDFGLSMMKNNSESVSTMTELHRLRGTPRYSAPEVLLGDMMNLSEWKHADVYSLSLVIYEIICNEVPFEGLSVVQLTKQVGSRGATPAVDESLHVSETLKDLLALCWCRDVDKRPTAQQIKTLFEERKELY
ncbi:Protein kinase domain, partial [Trinorchestia longiramus]